MFFYNWHWKMNHPEESNLPCAGGLHAKRIGAPRWPLFPPWVALKMGHPMAHGIQKFRCFKSRFTMVHVQVRIISFHNPIYFHKFHTYFHIHNSFLWVTLQLRSSYLPVFPKGRKRSCQKLCGWWGAPRRSHSVSLASVTCCWVGAIYGSMSQAGGKWIYVNLIKHDNFKGTIMILTINYGLFFFPSPL